jgi:hypothetical protein
VVSQILKTGEYAEDESEYADVVKERLAMATPRMVNSRLFDREKRAIVTVRNRRMTIKYLDGFADDRVNRAVYWYSRWLNPAQIARRTGDNEATLYKWLYYKMDLPRIGHETVRLRVEARDERILELYDDDLRPTQISERLGCSNIVVYEALKRQRGLDFGWGGPDPWVYELTGKVKGVGALPDFNHGRPNKWVYEKRHQGLFLYISMFQKRNGRGPTRDEIYDALGFQPWNYLVDFRKSGIVNRRKAPKEEIHTRRRSSH